MFIVETQKSVKGSKMRETPLSDNLKPLFDWLEKFCSCSHYHLKSLDTIGNYQQNCSHKNSLGNEQWRAVDGYKQL